MVNLCVCREPKAMVPKLCVTPSGKNFTAQPCSWAGARIGNMAMPSKVRKIRFMVRLHPIRCSDCGGLSSRHRPNHNRRVKLGEGRFLQRLLQTRGLAYLAQSESDGSAIRNASALGCHHFASFFSTPAQMSSITFIAVDWIKPFGISLSNPVRVVISPVQWTFVPMSLATSVKCTSVVLPLPIPLLMMLQMQSDRLAGDDLQTRIERSGHERQGGPHLPGRGIGTVNGHVFGIDQTASQERGIAELGRERVRPAGGTVCRLRMHKSFLVREPHMGYGRAKKLYASNRRARWNNHDAISAATSTETVSVGCPPPRMTPFTGQTSS